ncbi:autotransporter domain-containing protein [Aquibium carbonis]|nr:autotransporter domain-containing protein [Aquibium carbonis]
MTPGAGSLTVDGVQTISVIYASPQTPGVYDQSVTLTGSTLIDNPDYSGLVMQFGTTPDNPPQPVAVTVNATVNIGADVVANSGSGGFGTIWVLNDYAGTIEIDNAGTLTGTFDDSNKAVLSGVTNLGGVTITNSGSVTSIGGRGIYADGNYNGTDPATVSVSNTNTGTVQATTAGIRVIAYNGLASITNDGTVGSTLFQGLIAWSADGDATVTNSGSVTSNTDNAVYAATSNGTATVTNSGTVTATGDASYDAARALIRAPVGYGGLVATANTSGDIVITNEATGIVTANRDSAIRAATPEGNVTIVNAGLLTGLTGIYVDSGLSGDLTSATVDAIDGDISVTNSGTVTAASYAVWLDGTTNLLENTGTIETTGDTAVYTGNGDTTIVNTGTIAASSASGTAISMGSGNNRLILADTASLVGKVLNVSSSNTLELTGNATGAFDLGTVHASGQFQGFSKLAKSGSGMWTVTGSGSSLTDSLAVNEGTLVLEGTIAVGSASIGSDAAAALAITNGGSLTSENATVGGPEGGAGSVTISGTGSIWTSTGELTVGLDGGEGSIAVSDGASLVARRLALSTGNWQTGEGGHGSLTVTGPGTTWTNTGGVDIARTAGSTGSLTISNGASASIVKTGIYTGAGAEITITGEDTSVTIGSKTAEDDRAWLSPEGGTVLVSDGAYLFANGIYVGSGGSNLTTMTVTGAGTIVEGDVRLYVGGQNGSRDEGPMNGNGVLLVSDGAQVTIAGTVGAGMDPNSQGVITVTGPGSLLWAKANPTAGTLGNVYAGYNGSGTVTVSDGGIVRADNELRIGYDSQGYGVLNIGAAQGSASAAAGTVETSKVVIGAGGGEIVFNHSITDAGTGDLIDYTFAPVVEGNGAILHLDGLTRLTGNSSGFAGTVTLKGGILVVDGTLGDGTASVEVGETGGPTPDVVALLSGDGTIGGNVTVRAGGIAAGNVGGIGTLTIDGHLTMTAEAVLGVQFDPASAHASLLHVTGEASLAGSVELIPFGERFAGDRTYTILTADEGRSGAFDPIAPLSAFVDADLDYVGNDVRLTIARNGVALADVAATPNQAAAAAGLESLGTDSELLQRVLMLGADGARASYDSLSGEVAAATQGGLVLSSQFFSNAAQQRISQAFGHDAGGSTGSILVSSYGPAPELAAGPAGQRYALWTSFDGARGSLDGSANTAAIDRSSVGGAVGIDFAPSENARVGVLAAYHSADYDVDGRASSSSADSWEVGVYGGLRFDRLTLRGGAGYAWHDIDTARIATIGNFTEALSGSTAGGSLQLFGEISQDYVLAFGTRTLQVEPFAGIDYVRLSIDGYQETGGLAALSIAGSETDVAYSTLGIRSSVLLPSMGTGARLNGMLGWRHGFGDLTPMSTASFAGGSAFAVEGAPLSKNLAVVGAGVAVDFSASSSLSVDYRGAFGENSTDNGGEARFILRF